MTETKMWTDIRYISRFSIEDRDDGRVFWVDFEMFELVAGPESGKDQEDPANWLVWMKGWNGSGDWIPADRLDEAEVLIGGVVKWDGHSEWSSMDHASLGSLKEIGAFAEAMKRTYAYAMSLMKT
jgi:hypothetical protein